MKKWIITIVIILLLLVLYLIWGGVNEQDLGDHYYYLPKYEALDLGFPDGAIIYKSAQRNVFSDVKIHKNVISVNNNKDFIIAIQQDDSVNIKSTQSIVLDSNSLHYFIIAKQKDMVYGPLSKNEYLKKRKELNIPHNLKLKLE
ncbi:MAG: DUF3997 domain-containing protein [Candidatus Izemoplasmatales bacterium]|jgi:hypothetical protein|nr:DUF3997 domain-containing protein [Candidatus Izemoplasmatales bacterium]